MGKRKDKKGVKISKHYGQPIDEIKDIKTNMIRKIYKQFALVILLDCIIIKQ